MRITADTNVLLRAFLGDDENQSKAAIAVLENAELVAVSLQSLCEFAWALDRQYRTARDDVAAAIRALLDTGNVVLNRPAVETGLAVLENGGDFADGVIAHDGAWMGAEVFVSFDKRAVSRVSARGLTAHLLNADVDD